MNKNPEQYFYGQQFLEQDDYEAVSGVLKRRYISQGPSLEEFERGVENYCNVKYSIATSNATVAIFITCTALGLGPGDIAWTTALSFVATANGMRQTGATVDFIDIDADSFNIDMKKLALKLEDAKKQKKLPKLVMPVHFAGMACDLKELHRLSKLYGFLIVEDAAQAMGGSYQGKKIGGCDYSIATIFSLHPVKSITTGEGGLIVTNNTELNTKIRLMRSHGLKMWDGPFDDIKGPWHREMVVEGFNSRITEFQCALGVSQLKKLDKFIGHRKILAMHYCKRLSNEPVRVQKQMNDADSAWHMMIIQLELENLPKGKLQIFTELNESFIYPSLHYYPIPLHPFYRTMGFQDGMFPVAEEYYRRALTLPLHVGLKIKDIDYICNRLIEVMKN